MSYGLLAEFDSSEAIVAAAQAVRAQGYRKLDAYTPHPVENLDQAIGVRPTLLGWVMLVGALSGGLLGFFMQYYANVYSYPLNVGGRPLNSWVAFIPITFELTILSGVLTVVFAMFARDGFPRPHHPVFDVPSFRRASSDRYFLCVHHSDPKFDLTITRALLQSLQPSDVHEVPS